METKKLEDQLKSVVYVTVGAAAVLAEKAKELVSEFEQKGKATCEKCQVNNEELKHNIKEAVDEFIEKMNDLSEEELTKIKEKLATLETKQSEEKAE